MVLINNKFNVILTLLRGASDKFMFKQLLLDYYSKGFQKLTNTDFSPINHTFKACCSSLLKISRGSIKGVLIPQKLRCIDRKIDN